MNFKYCDTKCPLGKRASTKILNSNNSAYDAGIDFIYFAENCFAKGCPHKNVHQKDSFCTTKKEGRCKC